MISNNLNSQFVLVGQIPTSNNQCVQFGKNVEWLSDSVFAVTDSIYQPKLNHALEFTDGATFDGGSTEFAQLDPTGSQELLVYQVLQTNGEWINTTDTVLSPVIVANIAITGNSYPNTVLTGFIDNLFVADSSNPDESIKIFNNPSLTPGWVVQTSQEQQIDPNSISRAWLYDSITRTKLVDLEVVDLYAGILPGSVASELDFACDIDPACYNIALWGPGIIYAIGDRISYGGQIFQALYAGKSGSVFNPALWSLIASQSATNVSGPIKWGSAQLGKTWFNTNYIKAVNAQLGTVVERAQDWNTWFPKTNIIVNEWVSSPVPPALYTSNDTNGYVLDLNMAFVFDSSTKTYYFWVANKNSLGRLHDQTSSQIATAITNIPNSGIAMITAIANNAVAVYNVNQYISSNTVILHIDYVIESANNQLHNEFVLISNDGTKSWYNTPIYPKLVDSLSGVNTVNQLVPDISLPASQQVGILNNPVQSLFSNRVQALQIYYSVINSQLANLAVASSSTIAALSAFDPLPINGFNEQLPNRTVLNQLDIHLFPENYKILLTTDDTLTPACWSIVASIDGQWQIIQHQLYNLANNWTYTDWYSIDFTNDSTTFILQNPGEISQITYVVGDIVKILDIGNGSTTTYKAITNSIDNSVTELEPIYIENGTIQFLPNLFDFYTAQIGFDAAPFDSQYFDNDPYLEIRLITQILNDMVFTGSNSLVAAADNSFYAIIRYILYENQNLDWLFKTSFVTVDYSNRDLGVQGTFEPDNQLVIENFLNESTPFHTRIREFRDIYSSNDFANIGIVDFDLPAQFDTNYYATVMDYTNNPKETSITQTATFGSNVGVLFNSDSFYAFSNGLPNHPIDTYPNANVPYSVSPQSWSFGFVRNTLDNSIQFDTVPNNVGPIAVASNGVPFYSPNSGETVTLYLYGNVISPLSNISIQQTFTPNTVWAAIQQGENTGTGIPNSAGALQYFTNPYLSYNQIANTHSPLIGYAWDGNPIYGPYGFANPDGTGGVILNTSSYRLKTTPRLDSNGYPVIHGLQLANYNMPTGQYIEDYEYVGGLGTLDYNNGKICVTPEYPLGVYAYFVTVNPANTAVPAYPYIIGPAYYSKPYGLKYIYVDGINTPSYPNGNIAVPIIPYANTINFIRTPDGSQSTDALTLQEPIYAPWTNNPNMARMISTTLRFDRVSPTVEYITANTSYAQGSIVFSNSAGFVQSIVANANISTVGNTSYWVPATDGNIDVTTAFNRIYTNYQPTNMMVAEKASLLLTGTEYGGVVVDNKKFLGSYAVPTGSLFNQDDAFANITSLNISWRPGLISDTALTKNYYRFGNSAGVFDTLSAQYLKANTSSPSIGNIAIGNSAFTLEFFVNFSNISSNLAVLVDTRSNIASTSGLVVYYKNGNICVGANTNVALISSNLIPIVTNTWNFITINGNRNVYSNGNLFTYVNGSLIGKASVPYNFTDANLTLGADTIGGNVATGYMDELRLSTDINRYPLYANLTASGNLVSYNSLINIDIPMEPFPRSLETDPYFREKYTPILWGFESLQNESPAKITFSAVNPRTLLSDLSWNQKNVELVNYGANLVVDSSTLNTIYAPYTSEILAIKLNQGGS